MSDANNVVDLIATRARYIHEDADRSMYDWSCLPRKTSLELAKMGLTDDELQDLLWRIMFSMFMDHASKHAVALARLRRAHLSSDAADHCEVISLAKYRRRRAKQATAAAKRA